jgi:hypothetical protein
MTILSTVLTNSTASNIYVSGTMSAITTIHLFNSTGTTATANLYVVTAGNVAGTHNQIYGLLNITAQNTYIVSSEKFILSPGDTLQANCSASNAITATVSSVGI